MSSETPKTNPAKTKSAPRRWLVWLGACLVLMAVVMLGFAAVAIAPHKSTASPTVRIGKTVYTVELARTTAEQTKGLSGRSSLPEHAGMLFVNNPPTSTCIWMKDMKFPLDIAWLEEGGEIVMLRENVSPDTYPAEFCPNQSVYYVLEVPAGTFAKEQVKQGQSLEIQGDGTAVGVQF